MNISGRAFDLRSIGLWLEPHRRGGGHCAVALSKPTLCPPRWLSSTRTNKQTYKQTNMNQFVRFGLLSHICAKTFLYAHADYPVGLEV